MMLDFCLQREARSVQPFFAAVVKEGAAPEEATRFTFYETIGKLFPIVAVQESH